MGHYSTFVVKIWCDAQGGMLRGHVQHVGTRERTHFLQLDGLASFITSHLSPPGGEPATTDRIRNGTTLNAVDRGDKGYD